MGDVRRTERTDKKDDTKKQKAVREIVAPKAKIFIVYVTIRYIMQFRI